jgi:hypothetical protein
MTSVHVGTLAGRLEAHPEFRVLRWQVASVGVETHDARSSQVYQGGVHEAHPGRPQLRCPTGRSKCVNNEGLLR